MLAARPKALLCASWLFSVEGEDEKALACALEEQRREVLRVSQAAEAEAERWGVAWRGHEHDVDVPTALREAQRRGLTSAPSKKPRRALYVIGRAENPAIGRIN